MTVPAGGERPVALVTGAAGRIGTAVRRLLTAAGHEVIGVDLPDTPGPAPWWELDVADPGAEAALRARLAGLARLDVVVHAAGITALGGVDEADDATARRVMAVSYHGGLAVTRAALPHLRAVDGHVVVLSSVAGLVPVTGRPAYVGAKHAVTGAFRALGAELADDGVAVTVVHPTFLASPVTGSGSSSRTTVGPAIREDDVARAVLRALARGRAGRAPDRVLVGATARVADAAHRLAPTWTVRTARRLLR